MSVNPGTNVFRSERSWALRLLGDREPDPSSDMSSLGNAGTGEIYALWNALIRRDSPDGITRHGRYAYQPQGNTRQAFYRRESCRVLQTHSRAKLQHVARRPIPAAFPVSLPSATYWLKGRMGPKEKEELPGEGVV